MSSVGLPKHLAIGWQENEMKGESVWAQNVSYRSILKRLILQIN